MSSVLLISKVYPNKKDKKCPIDMIIISKIISKGYKMQHIKNLLHSCHHLLITSGAGMSADSGLPTFRDKEGFWREYPALRELGIDFQEIANPSAFLFQLSLAWSFYAHRHNPYYTPTSSGLLHSLRVCQK